MTEEAAPIAAVEPAVPVEPPTLAAAPLQYSHGDDDPATAATAGANGPLGRIDLAVVLLRVTALICLLLALPGLVFAVFGLATVPLKAVFAVLVPYVAFGCVGGGLWLSARRVGRWMLADVPPADGRDAVSPAAAPAAVGVTAAGLQSVLFSVVGVATVAFAVRHLVAAMSLLARSPVDRYEPDTSALAHDELKAFALEAVVGVAIFLGARGLSRLWQRARGEQPAVPVAPDDGPAA